ncbi:stromal processing peptidase, chloroplastic-like [Hibiscus syriacus]|uniref:stromal processing peptidase, chloroplastic-like n=1 Tax=Hibiscus syriacus TaxID=106335 RepID=UPI0019219BF4|nr:stromal processing peptidase, chloroplastic-like [Hibiscus syriacus]
MATSTSSLVMAGIQVPQTRWDSSVSKRRRSMVRVNIPLPAASFSLTRFHFPSASAPAASQWLGDVRDMNSIELYQNRNNNTVRKLKMMKKKTSDAPKAWKWSASVSSSQQLKTWVPCCSCRSCCSSLSRNCYGKTTPFPTSKSLPSFFRQRSCFPLSAHTFKTRGNYIRPLCATVGPNEPHAASTALPAGLLAKQDFDSLYPQLQTTELEGFLCAELPSHPKLHRGQLKNGLRYLILPNKVSSKQV